MIDVPGAQLGRPGGARNAPACVEAKIRAPVRALQTTHNVHVARQPIYTRNLDVYAYELLFRDGVHGAFDSSLNPESTDGLGCAGY